MTMTGLPEAPGDELHHAVGMELWRESLRSPISLTPASQGVRDSQLLCPPLAHNVVHEEPFPVLPSGSRPGAGARGRLR
jgi:hypothetical protein